MKTRIGSSPNTGTTIRHCEFQNAHDLYLGGSELDFHHDWLNNLNDEGLFLDIFPSAKVRIHEHVILKTLSPLNFAGTQVAGPFYIYRNLIDVRAPTAGYRPRHPGDTVLDRSRRVSCRAARDKHPTVTPVLSRRIIRKAAVLPISSYELGTGGLRLTHPEHRSSGASVSQCHEVRFCQHDGHPSPDALQ
jgi:hypothetical protein